MTVLNGTQILDTYKRNVNDSTKTKANGEDMIMIDEVIRFDKEDESRNNAA